MANADASPRCPRCGYDLSGHTASWELSCPVEGQCSECGDCFAWRAAFAQPPKQNPLFVEHCERNEVILASLRTLSWCMLPWRFWKRVHVTRPCTKRMLLWVCLICASLYVLASILSVVALWVEERHIEASRQLWVISSGEYEMVNGFPVAPPDLPSMTLLDVARGFTWPLVWVSDNWTLYWPRHWSYPILWALLAGQLVVPALLLLLPVTRRNARVTTGHVLRGTVFASSGWLLLLTGARMLQDVEGLLWRAISPIYEDVRTLTGTTVAMNRSLWFWILLCWFAIWWTSAIRVGYRLRHPWLLSIILIACMIFVAVSLMAMADVDEFNRLFNSRYVRWAFGKRPGAWYIAEGALGK